MCSLLHSAEKSWLLQQEKLLIEGEKKAEGDKNSIQIKSEELYEYPGSTKNGGY